MTWMLPVDKQEDGTWAVDDDPILHGADMTTLDDVGHLSTVPGMCNGVACDVYVIGETSGYVLAHKVSPSTTE